MARMDAIIRELSPEESRRLFRTYLLELAELSSHVHTLKSSRLQAESERDDLKSELVKVRRTIDVLKKSFSNALARQKGKYERELVSLLPSVEAAPEGAAHSIQAASTYGHVPHGPSSNQRPDDDHGGSASSARATLPHTLSATSEMRLSAVLDEAFAEDAPLMSSVLTSLQQQVASLSQEVAVLKEANQQLTYVPVPGP